MTATELQDAILEGIKRVRKKQDEESGVPDQDPVMWSLIITEETGEVARAILEKNVDGYIGQLLQVAASAVAALESHYRRHTSVDAEQG